mmetsp:Transcript_1012/g.1638  ORF Transcript_1012/g.1638 Transcript_1012/m.1638 type:complete len:285 (-) Transcript_1012:3-857(-)
MVRPREVLRWTKSKKKGSECPALSSLISHFNRVALWACKAVVQSFKLEERKKIVLKIIQTCDHLLILENYMGLQALFSALSHHSVNRMKLTIAALQPHQQQMDSFKNILSQTKSFLSYRERIKLVSAPFVPFTGCTTKDLVFMFDGNPDFLKEGEVNVSKFFKIAEVIFEFCRGTNEAYLFPVGMRKEIWVLEELDAITQEELAWWSKTSEPKDMEDKIQELVETQFRLEKDLNDIKKTHEKEMNKMRKEKENMKKELEKEKEIMKQQHEEEIQKLKKMIEKME